VTTALAFIIDVIGAIFCSYYLFFYIPVITPIDIGIVAVIAFLFVCTASLFEIMETGGYP
jgi:hypothetical protein